MFTDKDLIRISRKAYSEFSKKYNINYKLKFISVEEFSRLANKSEVIKDKLRKGFPPPIGALVSSSYKSGVIYINLELINILTEDEKFVRAIFIHEFFHIYYRQSIHNKDLDQLKFSEKRVNTKIKKEFPNLSKYFGL